MTGLNQLDKLFVYPQCVSSVNFTSFQNKELVHFGVFLVDGLKTVKNRLPKAQNMLRRHFCSRYDGYEDFCDGSFILCCFFFPVLIISLLYLYKLSIRLISFWNTYSNAKHIYNIPT